MRRVVAARQSRVAFDQFAGALETDGFAALRLVTKTGGPGTIDPLKNGEVTVDVAPGPYVLACFISDQDGVPHVAKGMLKPFTVTQPLAQTSELHQVNRTMTMRDFSFDMRERLLSGKVTCRIANSGLQPHELNILKLAPDKALDDVLAWQANPTTQPPFQAVGGMNGLSPGLEGYTTVDLQPGTYVAICHIPDPGTGLPHSHLGMIKSFTVD